MNKGTKIAAFTMMDILTGMVITSVVIGMVFYLFTALNGQVHGYAKQQLEINEFQLLKNDLQNQFMHAEHITGIPGGCLVKNEKDEITYIQEGDLLLRNVNHQTDTLSNHVTDFQLSYLTDNKGELTNVVSELAIKVNLFNQSLDAIFYKSYNHTQSINIALLNVR